MTIIKKAEDMNFRPVSIHMLNIMKKVFFVNMIRDFE